MKAVIVDIKNKYAAALMEDGTVIRCENQNYDVGMVVYIKHKHVFTSKLAAAAVCAIAIVSVASASAYAYFSPYSYVSLDVNPSIEYTLNRFDKVLSATGVNDDGKEILNGLDLQYKNIGDAISETVSHIAQEGYFDGDNGGGIVIAASSEDEDKTQDLTEAIGDTMDDVVNGDEINAEVEVMGVGYARVQEARSLGITPGKLNLIEKLQESAEDPDSVVVEEWMDRSVKDIMNQTHENKGIGSQKNETKDEPSGDATAAASAAATETESATAESSPSASANESDAASANSYGNGNASAGSTENGNSSSNSNGNASSNSNSNKDKDKDKSGATSSPTAQSTDSIASAAPSASSESSAQSSNGNGNSDKDKDNNKDKDKDKETGKDK